MLDSKFERSPWTPLRELRDSDDDEKWVEDSQHRPPKVNAKVPEMSLYMKQALLNERGEFCFQEPQSTDNIAVELVLKPEGATSKNEDLSTPQCQESNQVSTEKDYSVKESKEGIGALTMDTQTVTPAVFQLQGVVADHSSIESDSNSSEEKYSEVTIKLLERKRKLSNSVKPVLKYLR